VKIDTLRALFTYLTALLVIVGGGAFLYYTRLDPDPSQLQLVVSGFMGAAVGWVFSSESATRASRTTERALLTPVPNVLTTPNGGPQP
jgi:hypothetical protein